ncbi:MAG: hypothetical protein ACPLUL_01980 [Thermanaerothrix sp.]|uniref:hypothetical protein n=1 Tax=Thermanaerothrix sp. TaxID=2972675 RepID=UPI003C7A9DA6
MIDVLFAKVNPKWEQIKNSQHRSACEKIRLLVVALIIGNIGSLISLVGGLDVHWRIIWGMFVFAPFLFHFGMEELIKEGHQNPELLLTLVILITTLMGISAGLSYPLRDGFVLSGRFWLIIAGLSVLPLSVYFLSIRGVPSALQGLGLRSYNWGLYLLGGGIAGITLGVHLAYLSNHYFSLMDLLSQNDGLGKVYWWGAVAGALLAPAEEIALRGRVTQLLQDRLEFPEWKILTANAIFSVLVWLPFGLVIWSWPIGMVVLGYRIVIACLNTYVRLHEHSTLFGIAANFGLTFSLVWVLRI